MSSRKIPPELLNYDAWPTVDEQALSGRVRVRYVRLRNAVCAACDGIKSGDIKKRFGVKPSLLAYHLQRCTSTHPDGRIRGFRALVPSNKREGFVRNAEAKPSSKYGGLAGAFGLLLRESSKATKWLHRRLKPDDGTKFQAAGLNIAEIHREFLVRLRAEGRRPDQYPFNVPGQGYRALCIYVARRIAEGDDEAARARYGDQAVQALGRNSNKDSLLAPYASFERAAYDEWQLPNIATVVIVEDGQEFDIPLKTLPYVIPSKRRFATESGWPTCSHCWISSFVGTTRGGNAS